MATMAIQAQPARDPREDWITPQEQLKRLARPIVLEYLRGKPNLPNDVVNRISEIATRSIPVNLTNWYTSLDRLNALPDRIPPLPWNIHQILNGKCPIRGKERKPDGTYYTVGDTHSLYLDPFPTINALEASVNSYGEEHYPDENPLRFRYFWDPAREEHGNVFNEPQWILMSNDVLPGSRNRFYQSQAQMVAELSAKALVNYEVPTLKAAIAVPFLHKVATRASLYRERNNWHAYVYTYTRVQDTTRNFHLVVGGFAPDGLYVCNCSSGGADIGILAMRNL